MENYNFDEVKNCYNITSKQYSDTFCNELDEKPFDQEVLKRFAANVDQSLPTYEFGSGSCHISDFLYRNGLKNIVATDITEQSLRYAKIKFPHLNISQVNMLNTNIKDDSLNGIICFYGIVHFTYTEIEKVIIEWKRILHTKGRVLFCFHIGNGESYRAEKFLENENAKATWNFFEVDKVIDIMKTNDIEYYEVVIRYPYIGNEHPSKRCYIQFINK